MYGTELVNGEFLRVEIDVDLVIFLTFIRLLASWPLR